MNNLIEKLIDPLTSSQETEQLFTELVLRWKDFAYGYAMGVLGDKHLAEDAAQEAFVEVWRGIKSLREPQTFPAWFRKIIIFKCSRLTRRKQLPLVRCEEGMMEASESGDPLTIVERNQTNQLMREAINELPANERTTILLYYLREYQQNEIAQLLDVSVATVKKRLFTARKKLRDKVEAIQDRFVMEKPSLRFAEVVAMLISTGIRTMPSDSGLRLTLSNSKGFAVTPSHYAVPVRIQLVAKTDSTNIRLRFSQHQIILNWENAPDELRWNNPLTGQCESVPGKGSIPVDEWVDVDWHITDTYASLSINGEERHRTYGPYGQLSGQIGIGAASGSIVTVKSMMIHGKQADSGMEIAPPPPFDWDGGLIVVPWDRHEEAIRWYCRCLGMISKHGTWDAVQDRTSEGEKTTQLHFRSASGTLTIKSVWPEAPHSHYYARETGDQSSVTFGFATGDLEAAHERFKSEGVPVSDIYVGPDSRPCFEFWTPEGTMLYAVHLPDAPSGDDGFALNRAVVSVQNLALAKEWYERHLRLMMTEDGSPQGYIRLERDIWLVEDASRTDSRRQEGAARPYFLTRNVHQEYARLQERGVVVSALSSSPSGRWNAFHFYDFCGNRLNAWSY